ncbi:NADH-quinone oxidoreductase subunit J [Actinomyces sp. zg-332]|uniref:NADH-quinone oxidoreductase subunit J n=1 Tax=Actinomyces sp. zg-332 TaxID=2708340 RepID=UPI001420FDC3|nr:NADH-quinone oxidoreductase subunit J [Actinomyces sp. zg-332]QPK94015.1 NADH-quinone oxidoreductase subunit J [Actinomyces sp. zg-332]
MLDFLMTETTLFWVCAVIMIACALGVCFAKKPVHAVVSMLGVMLGLAVLYIAQNATFLGITQIVVYTGAILMMFLFVIMLIGTHHKDKVVSNKGTNALKILGIISGIVFAFLFIFALYVSVNVTEKHEVQKNISTENPKLIAVSFFTKHYFTMHILAILLVAAAIGALLLVHSGRKHVGQSQIELAEQRMREFAEGKNTLSQKAMPGVYATSNACNMENISGDTGEVIEDSIFETYKLSGQIGKAPENKIEIIDGSTGEKQ